MPYRRVIVWVYMKEYKGMRTFTPRDHRRLNRIITSWKDAAAAHGFQEYRTPLLDPEELYAGKTSDEIMNEQVYAFTDRGDRKVVLRPEITPGVSAMIVGMQENRTLRTPQKVFTVGSVFRYEKPQKGRTREHLQFNADIFGTGEAWAEAEVIELIFDSLERMGCPHDRCEVRLNDRAAAEKTLTENGVRERDMPKVFRLLDKRGKLEPAVFEKELAAVSGLPEKSDFYKNFGKAAPDFTILGKEPARVREVRDLLPKTIPARYDPSVVRGFDYYTGTVFEVFVKDDKNGRSVAGGGRYDKLIETYGGRPLPAVGFGMGDVVLADLLEKSAEPPSDTVATVVCALTEEHRDEAYRMSRELREELARKGRGRHFPVSFVGVIPEKKLGDAYRRYDTDDGMLYGMYIDEKGTRHLKDFESRETVPTDCAAAARTIADTVLPAADTTL